MKIRRNLVRIWLVCATMLPAAVQAQFVFVTNNGAITIAGYTGSGGAVAIPDATNGLPVTGIGDEAFYQCTNLNSVTIPDSVISIGHGAFAFCGSLISVAIPDNVTSIGICAFWNCTNLTTATLGTNATSIEISDFDSCMSLISMTIPDAVVNIGGSAFQNCASLTNVTIGSGVTNIGNTAFDSCASLAAITVDPQNTNYGSADGVLLDKNQKILIQCPGGKGGSYAIPNTVTNIANWSFASCSGLTNITLPGSVTSIGDWAFDSCTNLAALTISNGVTSIGSWAFDSCSSLTSAMIPDSVTFIRDHAFEECTGLTNVMIGGSVVMIYGYAFDWCTNLTGVFFQGNRPIPNTSPPVFGGDSNATAYYLPGTTGWSSTFDGLPTALWLPLAQAGDSSFGVQTNQFGFNITWASGRTVVVEACADLANPVWAPVSTKTLANGSIYFSDPQWTNYPGRFYRIRWP